MSIDTNICLYVSLAVELEDVPTSLETDGLIYVC